MINIERSAEVPQSLNTQEIKDYVDRAIKHKNDPSFTMLCRSIPAISLVKEDLFD